MLRVTLEDTFNSFPLRFYVVIGVIDITLFLGGLLFIYWADAIAMPPWNQHSVPPPSLVR